MTGRLQEQTGALMAANELLDTRRAFMEAVLSSVTAGVIALDPDGNILLTNRTADALLAHGEEGIEGRQLGDVSSELGEFMAGETREANVLVHSAEGQRTLAVKRMRRLRAHLRRHHRPAERPATRRLVRHRPAHRPHEIKNPLTLISWPPSGSSGATGPKSYPTRKRSGG